MPVDVACSRGLSAKGAHLVSVEQLAVLLAIQGDCEFPGTRSEAELRFRAKSPSVQVAYKLRAKRLIKMWKLP